MSVGGQTLRVTQSGVNDRITQIFPNLRVIKFHLIFLNLNKCETFFVLGKDCDIYIIQGEIMPSCFLV